VERNIFNLLVLKKNHILSILFYFYFLQNNKTEIGGDWPALWYKLGLSEIGGDWPALWYKLGLCAVVVASSFPLVFITLSFSSNRTNFRKYTTPMQQPGENEFLPNPVVPRPETHSRAESEEEIQKKRNHVQNLPFLFTWIFLFLFCLF
jgi:hypothetical protein